MMHSTDNLEKDLGKEMYEFLANLFPICRSITGDGVRETLKLIRSHIPLKVYEVPTGTKVFDWSIPKEWNIRDAYILNEDGEKIVDFKKNNLHVVNYSIPINRWIDFEELQNHLYSLEELPDAIPYVTSYYEENWGFCITHNIREKLGKGKYKVFIDSDLEEGSLTYGEYIIPGETDKEVFLSTYICHPSMANNELSGPVVTTFIAKWIRKKKRRYTYRIVFVPETIGSITYLCKNYKDLKKRIVCGFNVTCIGDEGPYSIVQSRYGKSYADKVASKILEDNYQEIKKYSFLGRGSDERQYCSPGIDLPLVTICRSRFGTFKECHTSLDNLDYVTCEGLLGGFEYLRKCIELLERNRNYNVRFKCEPQLGKRGLFPNIGRRGSVEIVRDILDFIAYADGRNDLIDISNICDIAIDRIYEMMNVLLENEIIEEV